MLRSPKTLHLEVTDVCQAACPQCPRELDASFDKSAKHHLSVEQIKQLFDDSFIKNLDKMFMCGNYGDPAAGKHTLEILRYFKSVNPNITLGMNTNGAINNADWWQTLATILNGSLDYVVFSIDGLEDTNHLYRKNVVWDKLIENAQAFTAAGGSAHWEMLVFEHNQHQVESAELLATELGFAWFRTKVSKRFADAPVQFLNPPVGYVLPNVSSTTIDCHALKENSIYVSATGNILPCCWLGLVNDSYADTLLSDWATIPESWETNPHNMCLTTCGSTSKGSSFSNQWQTEKQLK